eukprot:CAMPEP_0184317974 /NCGR_PEP_ID=MMETSP1049-20130417/99842_1 /TAXON_ID=77928 /ORGANISM="Proteomonas sulcata, Strain CCMP704" /LENGTH=387 /DNA_ID=CAMNT_0026637563 /DNA_START=570 /DNA_END=1730 /DNA_ORIENTATION=-
MAHDIAKAEIAAQQSSESEFDAFGALAKDRTEDDKKSKVCINVGGKLFHTTLATLKQAEFGTVIRQVLNELEAFQGTAQRMKIPPDYWVSPSNFDSETKTRASEVLKAEEEMKANMVKLGALANPSFPYGSEVFMPLAAVSLFVVDGCPGAKGIIFCHERFRTAADPTLSDCSLMRRFVFAPHQSWAAQPEDNWIMFLDRNPEPFAVILDFLRTGELLLPPTVTRIQVDEEMRFLGIKTTGSLMREIARDSLMIVYSKHLEAFVDTALHEVEKGASQGKLAIRMGLVQRPYGIGIEPEDSLEASEQLSRMFDYAAIDDDLVQVMAVRECRMEIKRRLNTKGVFSVSSYSRGDIYGALIPVHVWFVIGLEEEILLDCREDLEEQLLGW